jgi:hypothetical protein
LGDKAAASTGNTLKAVAEEYFDRELSKLRTGRQRKDAFERLVFPPMGSRQIDTIKRSEIVRLLDVIEKENGPIKRRPCWRSYRNFSTGTPVATTILRCRFGAARTARSRRKVRGIVSSPMTSCAPYGEQRRPSGARPRRYRQSFFADIFARWTFESESRRFGAAVLSR